ncbi:MAG: site-specific DNA-methyltransferase [Candidatus Heimdallarchaeota archaeon]|nr:site-specific DNA-methyltransferase [Candidatus Heimdallarchaeota archaeon]
MSTKTNFESYFNKIICEFVPDALNSLPDNSITLTITSPPYYDDELYIVGDEIPEFGWSSYEEYLSHLHQMLVEVYRITKPGGRVALVLSNSPKTNEADEIIEYWPIIHHLVTEALKIGWKLQDEAVWITDTPAYPEMPGSKIPNIQLIPHHDIVTILKKPGEIKSKKGKLFTIPSVWKLPSSDPHASYNESYGSFPDEFLHRCIEYWSEEGDIILDPYAGSGQTIRVSVSLNRIGIGFEADPKWKSLWEDLI